MPLPSVVWVENVSFRYNENSPYVLRDLSFKVRSVGPS